MILPIGDTPNPRRYTAWVNWALIAANVLVYVLAALPLSLLRPDADDPALWDYVRLLSRSLPAGVSPRRLLEGISAYDLFVFEHGYKPGAPEIPDLFASLFLHAGLAHLAGNMLFLWIYGDNVEHRLGRILYLLVYLGTGVVATLAFALFAGDSHTPLVGASGAISGVLGLYFALFARNKVRVLVLLFPWYVNTVLIPARWLLGFYVVVDNLLPFVVGSPSGVAYGAHLGGFVTGLAVAWVGERFSWRLPWTDPLWRRGLGTGRARGQQDASASALRTAIARGDRDEALDVLQRIEGLSLADLEPGECLTMATWLQETGHPVMADQVLRRCLGSWRSPAELARAHLAMGLIRLDQGQPAAAYQHLARVLELDPDPATEWRAREALQSIPLLRRGPRR